MTTYGAMYRYIQDALGLYQNKKRNSKEQKKEEL
jgi:hypothetical protein